MPTSLKFGLSEKFEKIFLRVLTNQLIYLVNVKTMRKIFSNYVCFSKKVFNEWSQSCNDISVEKYMNAPSEKYLTFSFRDVFRKLTLIRKVNSFFKFGLLRSTHNLKKSSSWFWRLLSKSADLSKPH